MNPLFPKTDLSKVFELSNELVDLNLAKLASLLEAQMATATSFVEWTTTSAKAATAIKDYDGLQEFTQEQTKIVQSNLEKLIADCQAATENTVAYGKEVQQIWTRGIEAVSLAA